MSGLYDEHAWLYDAAFSWDVEEEVAWLAQHLGDPESLLDLGCGSGRMLAAFARRGVRVAGLDRSATMLARARQRLRAIGPPEPRLVRGELADFQLRERFAGALCAVGTFGHLRDAESARSHLACAAEHLAPGARYLVQLDLRSLRDFRLLAPGPHGDWEQDGPDGRVRCSFRGRDFDPRRRIETQVARFELLSGERAGLVVETAIPMRVWDWPSWQALLADTPLTQLAAWDGAAEGRPGLELGPGLEGRALTWHELAPAQG